jgi:monofunctional biosynthetic peptidoglycan transglycosylase
VRHRGLARLRLPSRRAVLLTAAAAAAAFLLYKAIAFPRVSVLAAQNPKSTALMELHDAEARAGGKKARRRQYWVSLGRIAPSLRNAVLIAEDSAFFQHEGLDYEQIKEAVKVNADKLEFARGASTITQQLAKNLYLSPSKNPLRKAEELLITFSLERHLSKRRIFEIYLNVIEWGDGIYGAEAASRAYYGKSSSELSDPEAAALAAVIINPRRYSPIHPNRRIQNRTAMILERMKKYQFYRD